MNSPASTTIEKKIVLVVDDDTPIRRALHGALSDEGYDVIEAASGDEAVSMVSLLHPDCVLLDIWMPGLDGLETLAKLKELSPTLPIIMISGHATIATAVKATRMGASDFIEKPVDLDAVLSVVQRATAQATASQATLGSAVSGSESVTALSDSDSSGSALEAIGADVKKNITPIVFQKRFAEGDTVQQRTIAKPAVLYGLGLHSGTKSGLTLEPLPADSGIHFVGVSERTVVPAHVSYVESTGWATTLRSGETHVATIEHLMSALHVYGISNLLIKCNGEVPVLDGSAKDFCALIESVGLVTQESQKWKEILIQKPLRFSKGGDEFIELLPADEFSIDYTLKYPAPLNTQEFCYTLTSPEDYKQLIAPARTFGFVKDISQLQKAGLALGGRFDNFCLIGDTGPINTEFRFDNEPVRHKILDAIGDLYLLGRRLKARVNAKMSGHSDNIDLLRLVLKEYDA